MAGTATRGTATGRQKQLVQRIIAMARALGQVAKQIAGIEHMVVKGKVTGGNKIGTRLQLTLPVGQTLGMCHVQQFLLCAVTGPERFQRPFEFALLTDARKAESMKKCHRNISMIE